MNITNVDIGKLKTKEWKVSPTQVKRWVECPRAWGYQYIDDIKSEPGAGAMLGSDVHTELELYLKGVRGPDQSGRAGAIAAPGLNLLPLPGECEVELPIHMTVDGVIYRGFIDATWKEENIRVVSDHKTSSNPKKYGLTDEQLLTDPQGLTYGLWGLIYYEVDLVRLQWTYFPTKGRDRPFPVRRDLTPNHARNNFERIVHPIGLAIVDAVKTIDEAKSLPANPVSCSLYGGCPHASYCPRTSDETLTTIFGAKDNTVGLSDLIKNKKKAPPTETQLKADPKFADVVDIKGSRINSPEAPKSDDIARAVSKSDDPKRAAADAAGSTTVEEAERRIEEGKPTIQVGVPNDWDPSVTPKQEQVLAWVCSGTFTKFIPDRKKATATQPFAHGRSLGSMKRNGLINFTKTDDGYEVEVTDKGAAAYSAIADGEIWVGKTEPVPEPASPNVREEAPSKGNDLAPVAGSVSSGKQLVAVYQRVDGKVIIEIDPEGFGR